MYKPILNLGPFNDCVDMLMDGCPAKYSPLDDSEAFCFSGTGVTQQIGSLTGLDEITIPMFILGLAHGDDTPENRAKLIRGVELKILGMIYSLADSCGVELTLSNVVIPIKSIDFEFDGHKRLCITAVLGVAIFEKSMIRSPA